jgi:TonB family protein
VNRYLLWSLVFHFTVVVGGAAVAPMKGLTDGRRHLPLVISVGLVDMPAPPADQVVPVPRLELPTPAGDAEAALRPVPDLNKEIVADTVEPEPAEEEEQETADKDQPGEGEGEETDTLTAPELAASDTVSAAEGIITSGGTSGDVWGVEVAPSVNPYHRRGFAAIRANWRNPAVGPSPRKCVVRFRVTRSGELTDIKMESSSGSELFDRAAVRAVHLTEVWEEFPRLWKEDEQIILLEFEYRP